MKRKSVSKEAWNEASLLQAQHKSLKAIFESEPEEEHDDQQSGVPSAISAVLLQCLV